MLIDDRSVQTFLKGRGVYSDEVDGDFGKNSKAAARALMAGFGPDQASYRPEWDDDRVRLAVEQAMMESIGQDLGVIDGMNGPRTQIALERWQDHVTFAKPAEGGPAPAGKNNWPRHADALAYYGAPGNNHTKITPPYPVFYGDLPVRAITINKRCAESALRIMEAVKAHYGEAKIHELGLDRFGGCFNNRPMRNGTTLSTHAFAAAWDWDAARNPLRATRDTAQMAKPDYAAYIDAHEAEGWVSLGRSRNFDWMHFQAVRL